MAASLSCVLPAASAEASSQRVHADYYGVAYPRIGVDPPAMREQQLAAIARTGIDQIRITIPWYAIEPRAPGASGHTYDWTFSDQLISAAARHGLHTQVTFAYTPQWASGASSGDTAYCNFLKVASVAPGPLHHFAAAAAAMTRRYGRRGTFWAANPHLAYRPVTAWEIWNEPNLKGYWCPTPSPERYADMFVAAAQRIKHVNSQATVFTGGVPLESPSNLMIPVSRFFSRALDRQPRMLNWADAVAIHAYPPGELHEQLQTLQRFRRELREGGVPDRMPMALTEIGWSIGGKNPLTESERAERFALVTHQVPRTNCNVSGMVVHAWTTIEKDRKVKHQWYGIARPADGAPYPSAVNYAASAALMLGELSSEPPVRPLYPCAGMPAVDRDGGGVADHHDYYPLDPARSAGPAGWASDREDRGGGSGGGGGGPGAGGGPGGGGGSGGGRARCTISGDERPNLLRGTAANDVICGGGAADIIIGLGGHDLVRGGPGRDVVGGGSGRDRIAGGKGPDVIRGRRGADVLRGGRGRDALSGGPGADALFGGPGRDVLRDGPGRDVTRR